MMLIERLRGHTAAVTCLSSSSDVSVLASGSEDGRVCLHDMASAGTSLHGQFKLSGQLGAGSSDDPTLSSLCFSPVQPKLLFCSQAKTIYCKDLRQAPNTSAQVFTVSRDDINQVAVNAKATVLAAADDEGDVQVVDLVAAKVLRSLTGAHTNIATSVTFRQHRPWELITAGCDCSLARWDFSRGKCLRRWTLGPASPGQEEAQLLNPPFAHALATPAAVTGSASRPWCQLVAVAQGDGSVRVLDADSATDSTTASPTPQVAVKQQAAPRAASDHRAAPGRQSKAQALDDCQEDLEVGGGGTVAGTTEGRPAPSGAGASVHEDVSLTSFSHPAHLDSANQNLRQRAMGRLLKSDWGDRWLGPMMYDRSMGGHTQPCTAVCFASFGSAARSLSPCNGAAELPGAPRPTAHTSQAGSPPHVLVSAGDDRRLLVWQLRQAAGEQQGAGGPSVLLWDVLHGRKVNALHGGSGALAGWVAVADTSKRVSCYRV
ncbi:WD40-repeat-containing domain protein [Haematococcus lacustris]